MLIESVRPAWKGKRVVVLGLARQGIASCRYLAKQGARVVASDMRPAESLESAVEALQGFPIDYVFGGHPPSLLKGADCLFLSGGVPMELPVVQEAVSAGIEITNDSQIFLEQCPAPVLGITGSSGKSTTTALVGQIVEEAFVGSNRRSWVGGNIGRPLLNDLEEIREEDLVVMELSSFQLENMHSSPHVAAVLNITPNHLDRHRTMQAYTRAKARILQFQVEQDVAVLNREDAGAWALASEARANLLSFGLRDDGDQHGTFLRDQSLWFRSVAQEERICALETIALRGIHNLQNVLAACAIAAGANLPVNAMQEAIRSFHGISHRLEFVRRVNGADWYNDSIATSPERCIAALRSFDAPLVLLAGGRDKDLPWEHFAEVVAERVDHLLLFGEAVEKIKKAMETVVDADRPFSVQSFDSMDEAVAAAAAVASAGDVVLLSPGGTSYDQYEDFEERGEKFKQLVRSF